VYDLELDWAQAFGRVFQASEFFARMACLVPAQPGQLNPTHRLNSRDDDLTALDIARNVQATIATARVARSMIDKRVGGGGVLDSIPVAHVSPASV